MKCTNAEMTRMIASLRPHLERTDLIGYAAARNTRILGDELREFEERRDALIREHGDRETDENGEPTGAVSISAESPGFRRFVDGLAPFAGIAHEPAIFKIKYSEAIGNLSGAELLEIEWMFED